MPASAFVAEVDGIQRALKPALATLGYRSRGRTFNRLTADGLTQVINFQMGASDPPGTVGVPGFRENLHGLFTVNLGVHVPEVAEMRYGSRAKSWVQAPDCCIQVRLGHASGSEADVWWKARNDSAVIADVQSKLMAFGTSFLERFASRDRILSELEGFGANLPHCSVPRIVSAIVLWKRGEPDAARALLSAQAQESTLNRNHPEYVRGLARRMELGEI
jgi:hypothetical protein